MINCTCLLWFQMFLLFRDYFLSIFKIQRFSFYPVEFTPDGVLSSLYLYVGRYVRPSEFFWDFLIFGIIMSVVLHFLKKLIFWAGHAPFLNIFLTYKGLVGARYKSGDLCWNGFVCRFGNYIVVRLDLFSFFQK